MEEGHTRDSLAVLPDLCWEQQATSRKLPCNQDNPGSNQTKYRLNAMDYPLANLRTCGYEPKA